MEKCGFSENQFSFCFTLEYIKKFYKPFALPIFPSTVDEGKPGGGYDVEIDGNIFFQYKIPKFYKINYHNRKYWESFLSDYYKIKIDVKEKQFRLLKELSLKSKMNKVYYSTPEFHKVRDLKEKFSKTSIVKNSAIFSIDNFPEAEADYHELVYTNKSEIGLLFSDPFEIKKIKNLKLSELFPNIETIGKKKLFEQAKIIGKIIREMELAKDINENDPIKYIKTIHYILLIELDVQWYPVSLTEGEGLPSILIL